MSALALAACNALVGLDRDYILAAPGDAADGTVDGQVDGAPSTSDGTVEPNPSDDGGPGGTPDSGDSGGGVDANDGGCPGTAGSAAMVRVDGYCIDSTEVTQKEYQAFLTAGAGFGGAGAPAVCNWKSVFLPGKASQPCQWDPANRAQLPVVCVDWCDAFAYCRYAGKRLCGAVGDGSAVAWVSPGDDINEAKDEWYRACSNRGASSRYPYGTTFSAQACNGSENGAGKVVEVRSGKPACVGGVPGLHDMVGNAFEFENSCNGVSGAADLCKLRGGSFGHNDSDFNACNEPGTGDRRDARWADVGFRCCAQ